ncbi:hypothetical protein NC651_030980 [Populus alba x Populus x berolinensis]|nr:hypothetical protein NC651_030980 [Populus alba x Populus x berolinensis]
MFSWVKSLKGLLRPQCSLSSA